MSKPETALKNSLLPKKAVLSPDKTDFSAAKEKLARVYPEPKKTQKTTVRLTVDIPAELSKEVKIRCIRQGVTLTDYILCLLQNAGADEF